MAKNQPKLTDMTEILLQQVIQLVYIPMKVHHHSDKVHQLDYLL
ncbi:hypothetical protein QK342_14475 [Myroides odoratimimus]|nr:hypothetical protein [Myroides odoratimimus]WHT72902.1 hypothetical protein QK342_14475 [Myroides odoratimimus]WHU37486.1 hypothetical protein QNM93_14470 [Myroides odoratimimus]